MAPLHICLTGPESTGKTELAEILRVRFGLPVVPEFAREYALQNPRELTADDVESIARGEIALLDAAEAAGAPAIILDTDLLSTVAYSRHYYGSCPEWIEEEARRRRAEQYFLLDVDMPWVEDDVRDNCQDRVAVFETFRKVLLEFGAPFEVVGGAWPARCRRVERAVEVLLA